VSDLISAGAGMVLAWQRRRRKERLVPVVRQGRREMVSRLKHIKYLLALSAGFLARTGLALEPRPP
jgi:hypothetical protein